MGAKHSYADYLGYIRIEGSDIEDGLIDLQSMKHTVDGTERLLNHFLVKQSPGLQFKDELNFPVTVRNGCWEILIPSTAVVAVTSFLIVRPAATYLNEAAKQLGKNDIGDKTSAEIFRSAIRSAQGVLKIAKHMGTMKHQGDFDAKVKDADHIVIRNSKGETAVVTKTELDEYRSAPRDVFTGVAYPAIDDRTVHIGYVELGNPVDQSISASERAIFAPENERDEVIPELEHGMQVELVGYVSRGNQKSNTIGFEYQGHILTCEPIKSSVTSYIHAHYKRATIKGVVTRQNADGEDTGRPRIHFTELTPLETESAQQLLV